MTRVSLFSLTANCVRLWHEDGQIGNERDSVVQMIQPWLQPNRFPWIVCDFRQRSPRWQSDAYTPFTKLLLLRYFCNWGGINNFFFHKTVHLFSFCLTLRAFNFENCTPVSDSISLRSRERLFVHFHPSLRSGGVSYIYRFHLTMSDVQPFLEPGRIMWAARAKRQTFDKPNQDKVVTELGFHKTNFNVILSLFKLFCWDEASTNILQI